MTIDWGSNLSLFLNFQTGPWAHPVPPPRSSDTGVLSLGVKRPRRKVDQSPTPSAEVKNELYLHAPCMYITMAHTNILLFFATLQVSALLWAIIRHTNIQLKHTYAHYVLVCLTMAHKRAETCSVAKTNKYCYARC